MPRVIPGWPQPLFMRSIGMHRKFKETEGKLDLRLVSEKYPTDLFQDIPVSHNMSTIPECTAHGRMTPDWATTSSTPSSAPYPPSHLGGQ